MAIPTKIQQLGNNLLILMNDGTKYNAYPSVGNLWLVNDNAGGGSNPDPGTPGDVLFKWPFPKNTWNMNNGEPGDNFRTPQRPNHNGMDMGYGIANIEGTPIKAAGKGVVSFAGPLSTYGNRVVIDHPWSDFATTYNHMYQLPAVSVGQEVPMGTVLGGIGATGGNSTGRHLHFETFRKSTNDYIDPLEFMLAFNPTDLIVA